MRNVLIVAMLAACSFPGQAQAGNAASAVGQTVSPSKAADALLNGLEKEMMGVARAMPADKFDFTPASLGIPGARFTGVRTFGEEAKHVAVANFRIYEMVGGVKPDRNVNAIATLKTKDEIVGALAASFAFAHQAIATLTPENASAAIQGGPFVSTRESLAAYGVAHGRDHYGQMVEYLRMNGLVPPGSK